MNNKIEVTGINKALVRDFGDSNRLHDLGTGWYNVPKLPSLVLDTVPVSETFLNTKVVEFDITSTGVDEITDSPWHSRGNTVGKEAVETRYFTVRHDAQQGTIKPADVEGVRMPNGENLDNLSRLEGQLQARFEDNWKAHRIKEIMHVMINGTSYAPGGSMTTYDFFEEFTGVAAGSRPVTYFDMGNSSAHMGQKGELVLEAIANASRPTDNITDVVCFCGKTFFDSYVTHANLEKAMVNRSGLDNQDPLIQALKRMGGLYSYFRGPDNILYVKMTQQVGGSGAMIGATDAYFFPLGGVDLFRRYYAPAQTKTYVNTVAQARYNWAFSDEFEGDRYFQESNSILILANPGLVHKGNSAAA